MDGYYIVLLICAITLLLSIGQCIISKGLYRTIDRQQETIQRLINREPVTYTETGQPPPKPVRESFAAWGNEVVNVEELE